MIWGDHLVGHDSFLVNLVEFASTELQPSRSIAFANSILASMSLANGGKIIGGS
jgi:hypothetical protein